jgi:phosphate transport system protein
MSNQKFIRALKIDKDIHELRSLVLTMAGYIEESVDISVRSLILRDNDLLTEVDRIEEEVNVLHKKIDYVCFRLLACQSPVATDLRLILAIIKMNVDLERMGDLVCNNSYAISEYLEGAPSIIVSEIKHMATTVTRMIRLGFDAFMDKDLEKANELLKLDDAVDEFRNRISKQLVDSLSEPMVDRVSAMALLNVVRNLERLADHVTNIAEEVIFYLTGSDIRHGGLSPDRENV